MNSACDPSGRVDLLNSVFDAWKQTAGTATQQNKRHGMRRRTFLRAAAVTALAWPSAASAQQPGRIPVIGYLGFGTPEAFAAQLDDFRQGLASHGFVDGRSVKIEYRWAGGDHAKLPGLAAELVQIGVDVIATSGGTLPPRAAVAATETIPIVASSAVPLVESLARPRGNLTGAGTQTSELNPKRLELLHEAVPDAKLIVVLNNPAIFLSSEIAAEAAKSMTQAAASLRVRLFTVNAEKEFRSATRIKKNARV